MKSRKSKVLTSVCLLVSALVLSACGAAAVQVTIPDSLKAPCVSTVDVSGAQTVGDLGNAIIQGDADLRVCDVRREAIISIAESQNRRWWQVF